MPHARPSPGVHIHQTCNRRGRDEDDKLEPRQHDIVMTIHDMSRTLYTDQTGKFPRTSSRGNKYQMILHDIDSNST